MPEWVQQRATKMVKRLELGAHLSREAEKAGTVQQAHVNAHRYITYIHTGMAGHTEQTLRAHTWICTAPTTSSCSPFWQSKREYVYTHVCNKSLHMYITCNPSSSWAQALSLPSGWPWLPVSTADGTWKYEPPGPQLYSRCSYRLSHTHTHTKLPRAFWVPPPASSNFGHALRDPLTQLGLRPCHLLAIWSSLIYIINLTLVHTPALSPVAAPWMYGPQDP